MDDRGSPEINLYRFDLDEGSSTIYLGEEVFLKLIATVVNDVLKPISFLADLVVEPTFNFLANYLLTPILFHYGEFIIPADFIGIGSIEYDIDVGLPSSPLVTDDAIELYLNGGVYVSTEDNYAEVPTTPLHFLNDTNLGF